MLSVALTVLSATVAPGGTVTATVRATASGATASGTVLRMSATGGAEATPSEQGLGSVGSGGATATVTVRVPSDARPGTFRLTARVSASGASTRTRTYTLVITEPSGALPPGITPGTLPPGVPPITPASVPGAATGPDVVLPPVVGPQTAPEPIAQMPVSSLRALPDDPSGLDDLTALQAGVLAAMGSSVTLLLLRLRLVRRQGVSPRRSGRLHRPATTPAAVAPAATAPAAPVRPAPAGRVRPKPARSPAPAAPVASPVPAAPVVSAVPLVSPVPVAGPAGRRRARHARRGPRLAFLPARAR